MDTKSYLWLDLNQITFKIRRNLLSRSYLINDNLTRLLKRYL